MSKVWPSYTSLNDLLCCRGTKAPHTISSSWHQKSWEFCCSSFFFFCPTFVDRRILRLETHKAQKVWQTLVVLGKARLLYMYDYYLYILLCKFIVFRLMWTLLEGTNVASDVTYFSSRKIPWIQNEITFLLFFFSLLQKLDF